jgi:hypothetical protein
MYDGLLPLVAAGLAADGECWLSFPKKIDDEDCGDELECWKIPPHAGVEWPEELECVCCCGCGCCCCLSSLWK